MQGFVNKWHPTSLPGPSRPDDIHMACPNYTIAVGAVTGAFQWKYKRHPSPRPVRNSWGRVRTSNPKPPALGGFAAGPLVVRSAGAETGTGEQDVIFLEEQESAE
jgi:hypothetical protein